jgi:RNA polymerase sigma factor (sigma-70 family)
LEEGRSVLLSSQPPNSADTTPPGTPPDFAAVVREHWRPVYRLVFSLTGDADRTEDLTQETFLRALQNLGTFRSGTRLRSWLLRIASNAFFDEQRRARRHRIESLDHDPPAQFVPPERSLELAEQGERVRAALGQLSELTRLVFHLRVEEELPFREIAELAGTTEQGARWHMHHARTRLLDILGEQGSPP